MTYQDLHNHTQWSDGDQTIRDLITRAKKHKLQEIGISDHYELIGDKNAYISELGCVKNSVENLKVLTGIEIKIDTLLKLSSDEVTALNQYDYILIENLEYQAHISDALKSLENILNRLVCKIGWAHLDLERITLQRGLVVAFTMKHNIFLDFNFEETFYANLLQGYGQIEDIINSKIEIIVGSDTHSLEEDWWQNILACHSYLQCIQVRG